MASLKIVAEKGGTFKLYSPYNPEFVERFKSEIPYNAKEPIRKDDGRFDYWRVSSKYLAEVTRLCHECYGRKPEQEGIFDNAAPGRYKVKLEYMGLPRERTSGEVTASGWYKNFWNLIFPLDVLEDWFNFNATVSKVNQTHYQLLGITSVMAGRELKKAYRRFARSWHPDVCSEPEAEEMFKRGQTAYGILKDPQQRRKYDACLVEVNNIAPGNTGQQVNKIDWRPPLRCGELTVSGIKIGDRITVEKILVWDDIYDFEGRVMVTSWDMKKETFVVRWA